MRQVAIEIRGEAVRARAGAMSNMQGDITLTPRLPTLGDIVRSVFTSEARIRPHFTGTGRILLQPSLSGYHVFDVRDGESWIMEPGIYWASEAAISLGLRRERFWPSLWAGDGLLVWKSTLSGAGRAAINAPGPVEMLELDGEELRVQGRLVLGRTDGLHFTSERAASFPRNFISGQKRLRVYKGKGRLLVSWTPYWNHHMYQYMTGEDIEGSIFE